MTLLEAVCSRYGYNTFVANGYIMAGKVLVNDEVRSLPSTIVKPGDAIRIREKQKKYVTRAGGKLDAALKVFSLDVSGWTALDLGASEGGFTDCMLQHGIEKVYAVDVAYGIFNYALRMNPKVVLLERTNAKFLTQKEIPEPIDLITADVSFISLTRVIPAALAFLKDRGQAVMLFKPQFELAGHLLGKNGIPLSGQDIVDGICAVCEELGRLGLMVYGIARSPVKGNSGNIEYLLAAEKGEREMLSREMAEACVLRR